MKLICILFLQLLIASKIFSQQVKMEKIGGVYQIPCKVNGLNLKFIFDTGASDVSISLSEAVFMLKNGYLKAEDLGETQYYQLANGTVAEGTKIIIRKLEIGNKTLNNVYASIIHNSSAPLLLGQSALKKLGKYSFDYSTNTLTIGEKDKITTNENSINNSSCILYQGSGVYFIYQNKLSGANEKNIQEGKNVVLKYIKATKNWQISYTDMDGLFQILELTFVKMNNYDAIMVDSHGGKYNVTNGIKKDEMLFCHLLDFSGDYNVYMSFESVKPVN